MITNLEVDKIYTDENGVASLEEGVVYKIPSKGKHFRVRRLMSPSFNEDYGYLWTITEIGQEENEAIFEDYASMREYLESMARSGEGE